MPRTLDRNLRRFPALLAVLLLAAGCENLVRPQYQFAQVRVRVVEAGGAPVPNVRVVLYTGAGIRGEGDTGLNGERLFREVAAGAYGVFILVPRPYVLGPGELAYVDTLNIVQGARREVSFVLYPAGS